MSDEEAFLSEIVAAPDDDGPRLIYADWLEEQGDPRGTFIRTQCGIAKLHEGDVRLTKLRCVVRQLFEDNKARWIPRLRRRSVEGVTFTRGFPQAVSLQGEEFLRDGPGLFKAVPTLRAVRIGGMRHEMIALARSSCLALPSELSFERGAPASDDLEVLARSEHLKHLRGLSLSQNWGAWNDLSPLCTDSCCFENLAYLDLSSTQVTNFAISSLRLAPFVTKLQSLYLGCTNCDDVGIKILATLEQMLSLRLLGLTNLGLQTDGIVALSRSRTLAGLKSIQLASNRLSRAAIRSLATSKPFEELERLDLGSNKLGDDRVRLLATGCLTKLQVLDLRNNQIGDEGATALIKSPMLSDQVSIDLRFNPIGETKQAALRERFGEFVRL